MCQTQAKPVTRACQWVAKFDGGRVGGIRIRVGKVSDFYRLTIVEQDDMETLLRVEKETAAGYAEPYTVSLPSGAGRTPVCSCPGWRFGGTCRHTKSLTVLMAHQ